MNDLPDSKVDDILGEYIAAVEIPAEKGMPFLLCPIGLVGSGKTTVMKPLAEKLGLIRISKDDIRKALHDKSYGYQRADEILLAAIQKFTQDGWGIAADSDCVRPDLRSKIEEFSQKTKMPLIWIHINPPEEFIINKLRNYPHTWLFKDADAAIKNYLARKPLHQNLDFDFTYTFDPSRADLPDQLQEAIVAIKNRLYS